VDEGFKDGMKKGKSEIKFSLTQSVDRSSSLVSNNDYAVYCNRTDGVASLVTHDV